MNKPIYYIFLFLLLQAQMLLAVDSFPLLKINEKNSDIINILKKERIIIHSINSLQDSALDFSKPNMDRLGNIFKSLKPNFLTEGISIVPLKKGDELTVMKIIINRLKDITFLDSIPYYSKRNKTTQPLFTNSKIIENNIHGMNTAIIAEQKMLPFETARFSYSYIETENTFLFSSENISPLVYNGITTAGPGSMRTAILIEVHPGFLVCYGLGGAKAFTFFGLFNDRLETAIVGRIEAFYSWFFNQYLVNIEVDQQS
ncbi:DUF6675 family protein [Gracilinema caldarium]|uniref:Uncharacterized protein n=1 Tax=Gracilinema caldarium (strain ATCC 51460 / DSM 7334 / H1) TaxID=744872 RepID=F8EZC3_GRAC1|nr:DUF6675 family protein [Gracilinema caldarium]AEJ19715.1 hypothetical protein Spica_1572 [Gracilinema caldarium DSM 7334]